MVRRRLLVSVAAVGACALSPVAAGSSRATPSVPRGAVAVVIGHPITVKVFDHWMKVAARSIVVTHPGSVVIVPLYPPEFALCVAQVRMKLPSLTKDSSAEIRRDCRELFTSMSSQVLDFLIRAEWYEAAAVGDGIVVSAKQVTAAFTKDKRSQYRSVSAFRTFLRKTGQTVADIRFRIRVNLVYEALTKHADGRAAVVDAQTKRAYQPDTACAKNYVMADCARTSS